MSRVYFITHPDVVVDAEVPVPRWPLSPRGRARMRAGLRQPWLAGVRSVFSSTEQKALDGAALIGAALGIEPIALEDLGENDRSATGFLPRAEFESTADEFFAHPDRSVRGWETAADAQARIRRAVDGILVDREGDVALVAHGAVGTLLLCHLRNVPIAREHDQPRDAQGGFYYCFDADSPELRHGWLRFDVLDGEERIDAERRRYAEELRERSSLQTEALVRAFARVPREAFLGPGPWRVIGEGGYRTTPSDDPVHLYEDVLVAIDESRLLNNGEPSSLAAWFDRLALAPGRRILHVGAGVGYYTAILAETVGPHGRVTGIELDPALAARATANTRPWPNVTIASGDGAALAVAPGSLDAIFINAGATHPAPSWLDGLAEGGRLVLPLTVADRPTGAGVGHMWLIERSGASYAASVVSAVGVYPCIGARDPGAEEALREAYGRGPPEAAVSLRRDPHPFGSSCWFHQDAFCLGTEPP